MRGSQAMHHQVSRVAASETSTASEVDVSSHGLVVPRHPSTTPEHA